MYSIRKYRSSDRDNLRAICMETSDGSYHKSEKLLDAVPIVFNDYFTEYEPENIFVAADENDNAVGYVICASDKKRFLKEMRSHYIPLAFKTHPYAGLTALAYVSGVLRHGKGNFAHLHIDITASFQHMGVGTALIDALRRHLNAHGIDTVYVNTITRSDSAYAFYMKYGFSEYGNIGFGFYTLGIPTKIEQ